MSKIGRFNATHCDSIIHNPKYPVCLRYFILVNRLPAVDKTLVFSAVGTPKCFATYRNQRVRLTMASRFGDIGITTDLSSDRGYENRVSVDELTDFSSEPA